MILGVGKIISSIHKVVIIALSIITLVACGGQSSDTNSSTISGPVRDTIPPNIFFTSQETTFIAGTTHEIELSATDNIGITNGPTTECTNGGVISGNSFMAPIVSDRSTVECKATAEDAAGNIGSASLTFTILPDIAAPTIIFTSEVSEVSAGSSVEVNLQATDDSGVISELIVNCSNGGSITESTFNAPEVSELTTVDCIATAQDESENVSSASLIFTITPPIDTRPSAKNIVVIMLDDADFSDFGFNNGLLTSPDAITPNMDALRANGRLLRNFYAGSSVCSPSRASLLTGKTPIAFGALGPWPSSRTGEMQSSGNSNGLPNNIPQLGLLMKEMGKVTGHYGKWHVGTVREKYKPASLGFDHYGLYRPISPRGWSGIFEFETENTTYTKDIDYIDYELGKMVENFIIDNTNSPDGFFVNYWPLTPHFPWAPPESFDNSKTNFDLSSDRGKLLAMMYSVDKQIGQIVQVLKDTGQYEDTLILLTSDNGGQQTVRNINPYLKGTKSTLLEGGVKVSLVAHWPKAIPSNTENESVISMYDLLPTILDVAGHTNISSFYPVIDGRSKRPILIEDENIPHAPIIWELHTPGNLQTINEFAEKTYSILKNNIRLVKLVNRDRRTHPNPYFLYDLNLDPRGVSNIAGSNPSLVNSLSQELESLRKSSSRIDYIPRNLTKRTTLNMDPSLDDPRLDVTSKDFTLQFEIDMPVSLSSREILFQKVGSSVLSVEPNLSLKWEINGVNGNNAPTTEILSTPPLSPGKHKVNLGINGYRTDSPRIRIYIDDTITSDANLQSGHPGQIFSLLRNISPLHIGSPKIPMSNVDYYQLKIYPGE